MSELTIKKTARIGGSAILAIVVLAAIIAGLEFQNIRFGGPLHTANQQASDLIADILPPPEYVIEPYLEATLLVNAPGSLAQRASRLDELKAQFDERYQYWQGSALDPALKTALIAESGATAKRFWDELEGSMIPAAERGDRAAELASYERITQIYGEHRQQIDELVAAALDYQESLKSSSTASLQFAIAVLAGVGLLILALLVAGLAYLNRRALDPLAAIAGAMDRMAKGDTSVAVPGAGQDDEIGQMAGAFEVFRASARSVKASQEKQRAVVNVLAEALDALAEGDMTYRIDAPLAPEYDSLRTAFNKSVGGLANMLSSVTNTASSVQCGASEIRTASDDLAVRTERQAASLAETTAAMNEVTGMVQGAAESAAGVSRAINEAHREATEGGSVVRRAVEAMSAIEESAQKIAQITNVIDGIAFQTNLLALNAGVEAARAGDSGKGFAVVANEVRALAQRSADAAKDISALITTSAEQVNGGVSLVGDTGHLLDRIVQRVGEVSQLISGISDSAALQADKVQQVNDAVGDMDRMTQQNAAMVEESTAAARNLANEAETLTQFVSRFRFGGQNAATGGARGEIRRIAQAVSRPRTSGNLALAAAQEDMGWSEF